VTHTVSGGKCIERQLSVGEFLDRGLLQEINRLFLHPLGLCLEVWGSKKATDMEKIRAHPTGWFGLVETTDPAGYIFAEDGALTAADVARGKALREAQLVAYSRRWDALGYAVQPLEVPDAG